MHAAGRSYYCAMNDSPTIKPPDQLAAQAIEPVCAPGVTPPLELSTPATVWSLRDWLKAGQQIAFFRPIDWRGQQITALQFATVTALLLSLSLGISRLEIDGPALFSARGWLLGWMALPVMAIVTWCIVQRSPSGAQKRPLHLGTFLGLSYAASIPLIFIGAVLAVLGVRLPEFSHNPWLLWTVYILAWAVLAWNAVVIYRLGRLFELAARAIAALVISSVTLSLAWSYAVPSSEWDVDYSAQRSDEPARMALNQALFEQQAALLRAQLDALKPNRPGTRDLYAVVFAPYASENVFINENKMVSGVLNQRFDTTGRLVQLVNHATTASTIAWATPLNLERSLKAIAQKMDPENDVLLMYLTSHGASDFKLAASHWPLQVDELTPGALVAMLDGAGIRHRVLIVSACYSGGWIPALANDHSLVLTAADATHTSYGCGKKSELTFFGRALFDEQLRATHSFQEAFEKTLPFIALREKEAGKTDGFSNPQMSVGGLIAPVLDDLSRRLSEAPGAATQ